LRARSLRRPCVHTPRRPTAARPAGRPALTCRRASEDDDAETRHPATATTAPCHVALFFSSSTDACWHVALFFSQEGGVLRLHANLLHRFYLLLLLQAYSALHAWRFQMSRSARAPPAGSRGRWRFLERPPLPRAGRFLNPADDEESASRATDACRS